MKEQTGKGQRNRERTAAAILEAVDVLVEESGFEHLGINAVATQANVSKMLIYRYFGSMDGLIAAYVRQYDFWINFDWNFPPGKGLADFVKAMFREQISRLRNNSTLRKFYRWELTTYNDHVKLLREQREAAGVRLIEAAAQASGHSKEEIASMATLFSAAISYLSLLEENSDVYNGIPLQEDSGWKQIEGGINRLIDLYLNSK